MRKILLIILVFSGIGLHAQENKISGVVKDETNSVLPGASIKVENSTRSTVTDVNGKFTVNAKLNEVLVISYVGFETQKVKVTSDNLSIVLKPNGALLNDVVVLGSRKSG